MSTFSDISVEQYVDYQEKESPDMRAAIYSVFDVFQDPDADV